MTVSKQLILAVILVAQGCMIDFNRGAGRQVVRPRDFGRDKRPPGERGSTNGFALKVVEGKEPPTRLIARDETSCIASKKKYDSTVIGESVWCTWIDTNR